MSWNKISGGTGGGNGKSAYEIWLDKGNSGTEQDFLNSLKGKDGRDGADGASGSGVSDKEPSINQLFLPSADGSNEQYHPTVLYFDNKWNGYKYWMAATPYPKTNSIPYKDYHENPHIFVSQDGFEWEVPQGLINPIEAISNIANGGQFGYVSDPHLVYRPDLNQIELWYRITLNAGASQYTDIYRKTTTDGINWSERELMIEQKKPEISGIPTIVRSQAVIWETDKYRMWFNCTDADNTQQQYYAESTNGINWTNRTKLNVTGRVGATWHLDVVRDGSTYYLTDYTNSPSDLRLYTSSDGINWTHFKQFFTGTKSPLDFFSKGYYRGCLVKTGIDWKLYFSGDSEFFTGIGVMVGTRPNNKMRPVSGNYHLQKQAFHKGIEIVNTQIHKSDIVLANTGERIGFDYETKEPYFQKADGTKIYFTR